MKTVLSLLVVLYLGSICVSENSEESAQSVEDDSQSVESFDDLHSRLVNSFNSLSQNSTVQEESANNTTSDGTADKLNVEKKCWFLWPWLNWLLGCTERICFARGAYSYIPVCGYDTTLGYKTFKNRCFLNATNTCYSTNYTLNATAECS